MISLRLRTIIGMVPEAETVADIGSDHGKVSAALVKKGIAKHVVCTDISGQSLKKARKLVKSKELDSSVSLREGDGFEVLSEGEADVAVIAGMGGELMRNILAEGGAKVPAKLVLSCNTASGLLRKWLSENGYVIEDEALVFETRRFYPVMRAAKGAAQPLSDTELEFGPVILKKKPKTLKYFIVRRIDKTKEIRKKIAGSNMAGKEQKLQEIDAQLKVYGDILRGL